jgi:hypothetical protein
MNDEYKIVRVPLYLKKFMNATRLTENETQ